MDIAHYKATLTAIKTAARAHHAPARAVSAATQIAGIALAIGRLSRDEVGAVARLLEAADAPSLVPALNAISRDDVETPPPDPDLPHLPPDAPAAYAALIQRTAQRQAWRSKNNPGTPPDPTLAPSTTLSTPALHGERSAHGSWRAPHFANRGSGGDTGGDESA